MYAVGGKAEAAGRADIATWLIRVVVFATAGFVSAGGIMSVSRLIAASAQTGGRTFPLEAIAAAVIDGTCLFGRRGGAWSALLGALVIGSVSNGLDLMARPPEVKYMVEGDPARRGHRRRASAPQPDGCRLVRGWPEPWGCRGAVCQL